MTPLNTRIAPSPTGDMHLGTARTAYFNYLVARATGGSFLLRIDDTDDSRNVQKCVDDILAVMEWLGLDYDRITYQSAHAERYREMAGGLVEAGLAWRQDDGSVLLEYPNESPDCDMFDAADWSPPLTWKDEIAGDIRISPRDVDITRNLVLLRSNGTATYNFASVVDDIDFGINYVLRGKDHTANTSKQVILWDVMGQAPPQFAHVGLLFKDKKKLSKRDGAASMRSYMEQGYDPDAILNYMLRMGWGPTVDDKSTSLLPRARAIELFMQGGKLKNSSANVDPAKLNSFDRKYKARKR